MKRFGKLGLHILNPEYAQRALGTIQKYQPL